ncbi:glucosamine-6-phosphate deaminase [Alicyclobacillus sp. SO9]|uniref:glucosamine-6-phosphate deaminase n=1 Tax=Alicyclobacillus sp. SO9 TaxID=2665646 RepID=UPI0018E7B59C|nr:glucosamine-6-phosphate deaminase [Alicyclobacillus sp. SO9]QQE78400.1 glucosamine-6-phosphate deaminase [Alicyclobacillus sp. SO9]
MRIRIFETPSEGGLYVATLMEQTVLRLDEPVLGLATGSTVLPCYASFVQISMYGLDMSQTSTLNLDEYVGLDSEHPHSYRYFMEENLFRRLPIRPKESYIPSGTADNLDEECRRYEDIISKNPIDLQILGIGVNGHIGFNEPNQSLLSTTHVVDLTEDTINNNEKFFRDTDNMPKRAITMGVQAILRSKQIVLMAFGESKKRAVVNSIEGTIRTEVPASILQLHNDVIWVLDKESASLLDLQMIKGVNV